ncbi:putative aldehyde dehydrogenase DhaS [Beauveria bassiana]|nr:putative aldehyde dehydrogenase DhaS [Beauveria bassiana]KAH8708713.1 Aldehyde dehydrogenase citD [Beauveria bassiana]
MTEALNIPKQSIFHWSSTSSSKDFDVHDPATGKVLTTVRGGDAATTQAAISASAAAFAEWKQRSLAERGQLLLACSVAIDAHKQELADLLCAENGKPVLDAVLDVNFLIKVFEFFGSLVDKLSGQFHDRGVVYTSIVREPLGVTAGILPFNWPPIHAGGKIAPCVAAGNTIIIKPGEQAPLTVMRIVEILQTVLPKGVVQAVPGAGAEVAQLLAESSTVKMVSLTGSTAAGAAVARTASDLVKRTALELGGKNAFIVFEDCDLDRALKGALEGAFFNKGEACTAASRLLVHEKVYDEFVDKLATAVRKLRVGNGFDKDTHVGPVVSKQQQDRIRSYITLGSNEGAKIAAQAELPSDDALKDGYFVAPTLFRDVSRSMRIAQEEIFGPVATVCPFRTEAEAVSIVNESRYGLVAAIWSKDTEKALRISRQVDTGMVFINNYFRSGLGLPHGGSKESGYGREHWIETLNEWSTIKYIQMPSGLGRVPTWRSVADVFDE